ncbi:MAG TPA: methyl-accepting chemotaxis protein, partial [Burkholderiaceae bacterium]|nr:methyl-accepting chemotaxis protein [Burkholderiaceae bacterium]
MNLANLKIRTRLTLGFAALAALMALLGAFSIHYLLSIQHEFDEVMNDRYPKLQLAGDIKAVNNDVAQALRNLFVVSDPDDIRAQYEVIAGSAKRASVAIDRLTQMITSDAGKEALARLNTARAEYWVTRDKLVELLKARRAEEAKTVLLLELRPKQTAYMGRVDDLIKLQDKLMVASGDEVSRTVATAKTMIGVLLAIAGIFALATAVWIIRSVTQPIAEAMRIARGVADGNLSMVFEANGTSETGLLLGALHEMKTRLAHIVGDVRGNAEGVASASAQISQGNNDLSARTEQQASALQQTAASMEQLGATVRQNADNAKQADQLARGASTVAAQGGEVVAQVVETMKGINDSSKKVADIIGVIDGIAFQTNILALNAAVEAARAGEQGRGFAVVASEVRSLAQRSADAAKEIKTLIAASVERVEQGTSQVDRAGETMREVVASIRRVTDIVAEISAASTEQSSGVAQIGEAVTQMDQATQQNAALVEESAA